MSSPKGQGGELNKIKKPGNDSKGLGETSEPKEEKQQGKATPARQGTQSSKSSGACGTTADEIPSERSSEDDNPTKRNIHPRGHWRRNPREWTKVKSGATSNENGKFSSDLRATMKPSKEGSQRTVRGRTQSSDSQGAAGPKREGTKSKLQTTSNEKGNANPGRETALDPNKRPTQKTVKARNPSLGSQDAPKPSASRPNSKGGYGNHQRKQDHKGRGKGASREGDRGKQPTPSVGKRQLSGKNQDHRPGNSTSRNATSGTQSPAGKPHKSDQKKSSPRKGDTLDLKTLKENDCTDVVHVLNNSMARFKFFLRSEEENHNSDDFVFDLICTLAIACDAPVTENTNKILAALKGSAFFSSKIPCLLDRVQKAKTSISDPESQRRLMECLIKIFKKYLMHLPSSYADPPYDPLKETLEKSNIDEKDELKKQLDDFKQRRDDIIKAEREKQHGKRYTNKAGQKPPNDFREIPICPTNKEITSQERPFLRKNIKKGRYEDVEHYLDVQFRLLREDFLEPLREGIYEITHNIPKGQRNQLMKCYQGVRIVGKEFTLSGINRKVRFDVSKFGMTNWAQSKRLIFGSFLCLSKDNFKTMLFATVANRDPKDLAKGRFDIRFIEEQNIFDIEKTQQEYQMVESPAYFEAYRHVLKGLKGLNEDNMPFTEYLVECSAEVEPPEYLLTEDDQDPVYYDLSKGLGVPNLASAKHVPVLDTKAWPSVETLNLNPSQLEALRTAVTTEFSVIQGPPGTGKTYIGAKIVRCLLDNRKQWDPDKISPMLMVCYTNHALDQFLEKVLEFLPKREIIRVGGRCKSEKLEECNLKLFTKRYRRHQDRLRLQWKIKENEVEMKACKAVLVKADNEVLEFRHLEGYMNIQHTDQLYEAVFPPNAEAKCRKTPNTFKLWLSNNRKLNNLNQCKKVSNISEKDESQDGSILSQDGLSEDIDGSYDAPVPVVDFSSAGVHFEEDIEGSNEHSTKEKSKENTANGISAGYTETIFNLEPDEIQSPKSKDDDLSTVDGSAIHEDGSSSSKALQDVVHLSVSLEERNVSITEVTEHSEEQSQLLSNTLTESDSEADALTITVEDEATRIQNERFIEGDEEYTQAISQQSLEEGSPQESDDEIIEGNKEGTEPIYETNSVPFVWCNGGQLVDTENGQRNTAAETRVPQSHDMIDLTVDISNLQTRLQKSTAMTSDEAEKVTNIWELSEKDRHRLYLYWVECYRERERIEVQRGEQKHGQLCAKLEEVNTEEEEEVIRRATVVGMTTSGAARYHSMLQRISPRIVIIEEAAEVMEAHIITSLSHNTQHTILIGDHKQLRPKATVYELAQKYNLEISLFERMVLNSMDCKRLSIQHRMRPEIAALTKRIYEHEILDHESVCSFDDICGLKHNMFFIEHCQPEVLVGGLHSFSNPHEAGFLVALCRYLLLQGYKREQMTVLTMYTGQLLELKNRMPRSEFEGIKICVVDNFQGEENDIILLSLVRSNSKIGFLKESNRICVALSRARQGFYCIGNFSLLKSQCVLWKEICDDLEAKNAIGKTLQLVCKRHSNVNEVRNASDIQKFPLGGCDKNCEVRLNCGHACDRACHATDEFHQPGQCPKVCWKSCPNDHQCQRRCHHPFDCFCARPMVKIIPSCGHEQIVQCCTKPEDFVCQVKCEKTLDCGHTCKNVCGRPCTTLCKVSCTKPLPCGHEKIMPCFKDPKMYNQCNILVEKILPCEHKQILQCHLDPRNIKCQEPCQKKCSRGHQCQRWCHFSSRCEDCKVMVNQTIPSCQHTITMPCSVDPASLVCKKSCERVRICEHPCRDICGNNCEARPCMEMVPKTLPCEHTVTLACSTKLETYKCKTNVVVDLPCEHKKTIDCYAKTAGLDNVLCYKRVEKTLSCKHRAVLQCHTNLEEYKCKKKVNVEMRCGHTKSIPCCKSSEDYKCQEKVDVTLPCEHTRSVECSNARKVLEEETCEAKCEVMVKKTLPCTHEKHVQCFVKPEEVFCDAPCERALSCEHICNRQCSDDCTKVKCTVTVEKDLACGQHKISCLCSDDISGINCLKKCTRKLPCGHICARTCSENCSDFQCEEMVMKKLNCKEKHYLRMACFEDPIAVVCLKGCNRKLDCDHPCSGVCGQPCETVRCMRKIEMTFTCDHKTWLSCFQRKFAICRAPCLRPKSSCGHLCEGWCGERCTKYPCKVPVTKTLRCGHKIKMRCCHNPENVRCPAVCGVKLQCGHLCSGKCSDCQQRDSHQICQNPCGRLLVCLHRCRAACCEPCPPCVSSCSRRCPHKKCKQHCSKPCKPCTKPCTWSCPHYQCNNLCGEECTRPRCDAPCPKMLPCGHPCIGLCGEACPTFCAICHAKKPSFMSADRSVNEKEPTRCLQLFDCGHIMKVEEMDAWMMSQHGSDVQLVRCPRCSTPITFSYRYGNIIKRALKSIESVKAQVQELAVEVSNSVYRMGRELRHQKYDVNKLKFPQAVLLAVQPSALRVPQMHERSILFLFIVKNHFTILQRVQETQQVLANVHTVQVDFELLNPQSEVGKLSNITTNALENIKTYLEQPRLDLKALSRVHEQTRKFFLFSHVLEVQTEAAKLQIALTKKGKRRLRLACDRFAVFLQGNDAALELQWLREIVDLLRKEVHFPPLPPEETADFTNFPGCQKGVWKSCNEGHVYFTGITVRGGEDIPVGSDGCTRCTADVQVYSR